MGYTSYDCVKLQRLGVVKDLSGVHGNFTDINRMAGLYFGDFEDPNAAMLLGGMPSVEDELVNMILKQKQEEKANAGTNKTYNVFGEPNLQALTGIETSKLQETLGPKYEEFKQLTN